MARHAVAGRGGGGLGRGRLATAERQASRVPHWRPVVAWRALRQQARLQDPLADARRAASSPPSQVPNVSRAEYQLLDINDEG